MMRTKWQERGQSLPVSGCHHPAPTGTAWRNAYVIRSLLAAHPLHVTLLSVRESLFATKGLASRYSGLYGETVFALKAWDAHILGQVLAAGDELPGGTRFLGFVDEFTPGVFERMHLHLTLPSEHFPEAGLRLREYLQTEYVPVNIRGTAGGYVLDIPEKARKSGSSSPVGLRETDGIVSAGCKSVQVRPAGVPPHFCRLSTLPKSNGEVRDLVL